ncbi:MAG: hypothetical protein SVT52_08970 [Planctomycetota bacterium]|nr:hypothetical protein [Planctomycetota bacterium]
MIEEFNSVADDFFVNLNLQTTLPLPDSRETILHFCEAVQKRFGSMRNFYRREGSREYVLEGDHDSGSYQWLELHKNRLAAGCFNPPSFSRAHQLHQWLLEHSIYYLGLSPLDIECLDVLYGFNLDFVGNRDAIVAEALLNGSPLAALALEEGAKTIEFEPSMVIALDEGEHLQARLSLETRGSSYQTRTGQYEDQPISVYFTVRRYSQPEKLLELKSAFTEQCDTCEDISSRIVIPNVVRPIATAIATAQ